MSHERRARSRMLKPGAEHDRSRVFTERSILAVLDHADDFVVISFTGLSLEQPTTNRILTGPELIRHHLVDDRHRRGIFSVGGGELTTSQQDGSHRGKVARTNVERL